MQIQRLLDYQHIGGDYRADAALVPGWVVVDVGPQLLCIAGIRAARALILDLVIRVPGANQGDRGAPSPCPTLVPRRYPRTLTPAGRWVPQR